MRRLLTGYAVTFNLRHRRSGHLFQNRYKSIVCDEEDYLLELVRYIHLNPLRAGHVSTLDELDRYPWSGHAMLLGEGGLPGQVTAEVLCRFGKSISAARRSYRSFIEDGIAMGRRSDLVGAGRQRQQSESVHPEESERQDSRVLGRGDFVEQILLHAELGPRPAKLPIEEIIERVCGQLGLSLLELTSQTRAKRVADARSIICHAAFACGHRGVDIARRLGITGSGVTIAARRGRQAISAHPELLAMVDGRVS